MSDTLARGRRIRLLTVVDTYTREALAIELDTSVPGTRVAQVLDERGCPEGIRLDNGPELTSKILDQWAYDHGVELRFIDPGKPIQNAWIESFNGRLRDWFGRLGFAPDFGIPLPPSTCWARDSLGSGETTQRHSFERDPAAGHHGYRRALPKTKLTIGQCAHQ